MSRLLLSRPNQASTIYGHEISTAYATPWVDDPDFASMSDVEAWWVVLRDPVVRHAIMKRMHSVAGNEWNMEPATDEKQDKLAASAMEQLFDKIQRFSDARFFLTEAIFRGNAGLAMCGKRMHLKMINDEIARKWFVITHLDPVDKFRFRKRLVSQDPIRTKWFLWSIARKRYEDIGNEIFNFVRHFYNQSEASLGYGAGLLEAMYNFVRGKNLAYREGMNGLSRWAQGGWVIIKIDGARDADPNNPNTTIAATARTQFEKHLSRHIATLDKEDDVEIKQPSGQGQQIVRDMIDYFDDSLTQLILTSLLPTGGGSGGGSFARAAVEAEVQEATFQFDRKLLAETITTQLVRRLWDLNFHHFVDHIRDHAEGGAELPTPRMPSFRIIQQPFENPVEAMSIIVQAAAVELPLREDEVYQKIGYTRPTEDDKVFDFKSLQQSQEFSPLFSALLQNSMTNGSNGANGNGGTKIAIPDGAKRRIDSEMP